MTDEGIAKAVEAERARCLACVEAMGEQAENINVTTATRFIKRQIRNAILNGQADPITAALNPLIEAAEDAHRCRGMCRVCKQLGTAIAEAKKAAGEGE